MRPFLLTGAIDMCARDAVPCIFSRSRGRLAPSFNAFWVSARLQGPNFNPLSAKSVLIEICCAAYEFFANDFAIVCENVCDDFLPEGFLKSVKRRLFALTLPLKKISNGCLKGIFWGAEIESPSADFLLFTLCPARREDGKNEAWDKATVTNCSPDGKGENKKTGRRPPRTRRSRQR